VAKPKFKKVDYSTLEFPGRGAGGGRGLQEESQALVDQIESMTGDDCVTLAVKDEAENRKWQQKLSNLRKAGHIPSNTRCRTTSDGNLAIFFGKVVPSLQE